MEPPLEKLDVFTETFSPLDPPSATYDEVHQNGLWHQTFACWLVNRSKRTVVLQLRGPKNRVDPGTFDASAGGHLSSGENPSDGFRELKEELGITIPENNRAYLGVFRNISVRGEYTNREFCHIFLAESIMAPSDMTPEKGELNGIFEISIDDGIYFFSGKTASVDAAGIEWDGQEYKASKKTLTEKDMCNSYERCHISKYYLKVMLAAQGFIQGSKILVI